MVKFCLSHCRSKFLSIVGVEFEFLSHSLPHVGQIEQDTDHVTLFAVVVFIGVSVDHQVIAIGRVNGDVAEVARVIRIGQHVVPSDARDWFLGHSPLVQCSNNFLVCKGELVLFFQVVGLVDEPVCVLQLDSLEEVWQVLIHLDHVR